MAGANVGNLNVKLTLSAEQFAAALMAAGGDVNAFAMKVEAGKSNLKGMDAAAASTATNVKSLTTEIKNYNVASIALRNVSDSSKLFVLPRRSTEELIAAGNAQRTSLESTGRSVIQLEGRFARLAPVITAVSYGAQDAASQLGNRGVGAAMQGLANNIPMIGAALGGMKGLAIASVISAGVQTLGSYVEYLEKAAKRTKELQDATSAAFSSRLDSVQGGPVGRNRFGRDLASAMKGGIAGVDALAQPLYDTITDTRTGEIALREEKKGALLRLGNANQRIENEMRFNRETEAQVIARLPHVGQERDMANKQLAEINAREKASRESRGEAERRLKEIEKVFPQVAKAERDRIAQEDAVREKAWRAADSEETRRRAMKAAQPAPGVGATEAGSSSQFSQIQAAIRQAQQPNQLEKERTQAAKKAVDKLASIDKKTKRLKVVKI